MIHSRLVVDEHTGEYSSWFGERTGVNQIQLRTLQGRQKPVVIGKDRQKTTNLYENKKI